MTMSILQNSTLPSLRQFDALGGLFFSAVRERAVSQRFVRELNVQPPALDRKVRYLERGEPARRWFWPSG